MSKSMSLIITILGVVAIVIGAVFLFQGVSKNNLIVERMNIEKVSFALNPDNPSERTQVQNAPDAQKAADIIAEHRRKIAPTYQDLLGTSKFNSSNTTHLTYAQAMNLENYLYLSVASFGLVLVVLGSGAYMILSGIALGAVGMALRAIAAKLT